MWDLVGVGGVGNLRVEEDLLGSLDAEIGSGEKARVEFER